MIIMVRQDAPREEIERLRALLLTAGCEVRETESTGALLLLADRFWPEPPTDLMGQLKASTAVISVLHSGAGYQLVAAKTDLEAKRFTVKVKQAVFGEGLEIIAGPCTVESEEVLLETAQSAKESGAKLLRGGAYKPTTSPYSFAGLGGDALKTLRSVAEQTGLGVVTEVMDPRKVEMVGQFADMLQIGARSMQNFDLLREVGKFGKPVLLKRGMAATIDEWLCAAEYIALEGNEKIVLCERGIRNFDKNTRNTLDISAIPVLRSLSKLPVIVDPSHAAGKREWVEPLALAAVAAGADGLIIETHPRPSLSIKDGAQTVSTEQLNTIALKARAIRAALSEPILREPQ